MANASKKKGTGGETELLRIINAGADLHGINVRRTPASSNHDLDNAVEGTQNRLLQVLATRPDRGRWLVTLDLNDFLDIFCNAGYTPWLHIEVKRYTRFALHTIYDKKFGGGHDRP